MSPSAQGMTPDDQHRAVSEYYGKTLATSTDLKTSACCPIGAVPEAHRAHLAKLHPEVLSRFYGCGSPIPESLTACTVLDLGCGTGRDAYLASALVGPDGTVIGIDMTDPQLDVAIRHRQFHADAFFGEGARSNVQFKKGYIEDLRPAGIEDDTVDVVISNCVCNLSPDKKAVFSEVARVLKDGGEFYFSDVYADRRLSEDAQKHETLVAECLGGALYLEDFRRIMADVGFKDIRVVSATPVNLNDPQLKTLVPDVTFYSVTVRAFNISGLEDRRENYGQVATYTSCCGSGLKLDIDNNFEKGVPVAVDANTAAILQASRFKGNFEVSPRGTHQGLFLSEGAQGTISSSINSFRPAFKTATDGGETTSKDASTAPSCSAPSNGATNGNAIAQAASCCGGANPTESDKDVDSASKASPAAPTTGSSCCSRA